MNKLAGVAIALIIAGMLMLLASICWPRLQPAEDAWSEEQAVEQSNASTNLHQMAHRAGISVSSIERSKDADEVKQRRKAEVMEELEAAQQRFATSRQTLDDVRSRRQSRPIFMRWIGIGLMLVGVSLHMIVRGNRPGWADT